MTQHTNANGHTIWLEPCTTCGTAVLAPKAGPCVCSRCQRQRAAGLNTRRTQARELQDTMTLRQLGLID